MDKKPDWKKPRIETDFSPKERASPESPELQGRDIPKQEAGAISSPAPSRLKFSRQEVHDQRRAALDDTPAWKKKARKEFDKLEGLERKADKAQNRFEKAVDRLPVQTRAKLGRSVDPKTGKRKLRLSYEQRIAPEKNHVTQAIKRAGAAAGASGSALQGQGRDEQQADSDSKTIQEIGGAGKTALSAPGKVVQHNRARKYRRAARLERKSVKATAKYRYQAIMRDNPSIRKSGFVNKALWKRRVKRQVMQEARAARKGVRVVQKAGDITKKALKKLVSLVLSKLRVYIVIGGVVVLLIVVLFSFAATLMMMLTGLGTGAVQSTYAAENVDIADADWYFSDLEAGLQEELDNVQQNNPGYDEYQFHLDGPITHDPFQLAAYLCTMYEDFSFAAIRGEIEALFHDIYTLRYETETQTRYDSDDNPYEWRILHTYLEIEDFYEVIRPRLDSKQDAPEQYDLYMDTEGNHQVFGTPFNFGWRHLISCHYGGRDNPTGANTGATTASGQEMHTGMDIAVATGTPIYSVMKGTVTYAGWHDLYGYYVDVSDENGNMSRYAHCSRLLVGSGDPVIQGQAIAESGSTGNVTGPHLHIEIFIKGQRVNPYFLLRYGPTGE